MKKSFNNHYGQINVASKDELKRQLYCAAIQKNLFRCIAFGRENPNYDRWMLLTCLKFQLLSCLFYIKGEKPVKLPLQYYESLFDAFVGNLGETKDHLMDWCGLTEEESSKRVEAVYAKYTAVEKCCLGFIADPLEAYYANEFHAIIEYILTNEISPDKISTAKKAHKFAYGLINEQYEKERLSGQDESKDWDMGRFWE